MMILIAALMACAGHPERCPGPDRSPFAGSCVGSDYADTDECQRFLRRAARIERRLIRIGFAPYDAWYDSIYLTPAERRREIHVLRVCGPNGATDDDGVNISCDQSGWNGRAYVCGNRYQRHILSDPQGRPRRDDPAVWAMVRRGWSLDAARIQRAFDVIESRC